MGMQISIGPPDIASADAANEIAERNGWPVLYDSTCQFSQPKLSELLSLWYIMADCGVPRRQDMTARLLQPYMRMLALYERIPAEGGTRRYRVRLMGSAVVQVLGELTGRFLDDAVPEKFLPRWYTINDIPLATGVPLRVLVRSDTFDKSHIVGELFCAPLRAEDGDTRLVLHAACFDGSRSWTDVAAEARQRLGLGPAGIV